MRRIILLSTVLFATPFGIECYASDCATTSCQTLGYTATSNKGNCLQCPFGNYWFCPKSQCDSSYQYTCTGYMQSPSGTACNGKYQKCNCSNNYVWNASQGLCLACTSLCTGYTLTYEQAVQQCGSSNAFACLDNCTGNRMYKCGTNTGSGSGSGSGSGGECEKVCITYQISVSFECRSSTSPYHLYRIYHDFKLQNDGSYKEDTSGSVSIYIGKYNTLTACQNEANNRKNELGDKYCVASECK